MDLSVKLTYHHFYYNIPNQFLIQIDPLFYFCMPHFIKKLSLLLNFSIASSTIFLSDCCLFVIFNLRLYDDLWCYFNAATAGLEVASNPSCGSQNLFWLAPQILTTAPYHFASSPTGCPSMIMPGTRVPWIQIIYSDKITSTTFVVLVILAGAEGLELLESLILLLIWAIYA